MTLNLNRITTLVPDLAEDLLSSVDQPLTVRRCRKTGRDYLLCDYNRDGDSYRSPWSNEFDPPIDDGTIPSEKIRKLEVAANDAFDVYRELYYDSGTGSTYFWDLDDGFAGVVLLKKGISACPHSEPHFPELTGVSQASLLAPMAQPHGTAFTCSRLASDHVNRTTS